MPRYQTGLQANRVAPPSGAMALIARAAEESLESPKSGTEGENDE